MSSVDPLPVRFLRKACALLVAVFSTFFAYAQCDCPPVSTCGACTGGMTRLTFKYDDPNLIALPSTVTVTDGGGIIFVGLIADGGTFEVTANIEGNPFIGNQITVSSILSTVNVTTSCATPIFVGAEFGFFEVIAGESMGGLPICCSVSDMETTDPVIINCPSNITTALSSTLCTKVVNWTAPSASDNCGIESLTSTHLPNTAFPRGTTTVTYTATDRYGNTSQCSFTVTVNDITLPTINNCPSTITVNADPTTGTCGTNVSWTPPTASDNCSVNLTSNKVPGQFFSVGTKAVTYTATDAGGNQATCTFNVVVNDVTNPVIAGCPTTITVNAAANACSQAVTWTPPTVTDNCAVSMTSNFSPGATFPVGTTPVTYTATDASGRQMTCTFNVVVKDVTKPVITGCPSNISVNTSTCSAVVSWSAPAATDACGVSLLSSVAPGSVFPVGVTPVTYTATDPSGNTETCTFNVTVRDNVAPVFANCPNGVIHEVLADNACTAIATWTPLTATDNCSVIVTSNYAPGAAFPIGMTNVIYTATDPSGNTTTCTFKVHVKDRIAPVISGCVGNIAANTASACGAVVNWTVPIATDNCDVEFTSDHVPGEMFPVGTTTVTYTATDDAGNSVQCSFNVVVTDTSVPLITACPLNIIVPLTGADCNASVHWVPPSFSDNCAVTVTSNKLPGSLFNLGTTTVTYSGVDAAGNTATCSFNVMVVDDSPPVISNCPVDISLFAGTGCAALASWTAPDFVDNCSATITGTHSPGQSFPVGITVVTYTATDDAGNVAVCSFEINVIDNSAPIIQNCPSSIAVMADGSLCGKAVTWTPPVATDNCLVSMTSNFAPGHIFPEGITEVVYTATDASGNTATCTFTITVTDETVPVVTNCPGDIVVNAGSSCSQSATWTAPTFADNCGTLAIASTHQPSDVFPVGITNVVYTATDASGNSATCHFSVTVTDNSNPVISNCPGNISALSNNSCNAVVSWIAPTAADNCVVTMTSTHAPGTIFAAGSTLVTYTAIDASGNTSMCSFTVTVTDGAKPVFTLCPTDINVSADANCQGKASWSLPTYTDCSTATMTSSHTPGTHFPIGSTLVTYTVTDDGGNAATCTFKVNVTDDMPPVFASCPETITLTASATCDAIATWTLPSASDNCGTLSMTASHQPGDIFPIGISTVIYTASDAQGNISKCEFNVVVKNATLPVIENQPQDILVKVIDADEGVVSWNAPSATVPCGSVILSSSHTPGEQFPVGETVVEYVAVDEAGNSSKISFRVIVHYEDLAIEISKLVTPDNDGINDAWTLKNIEKFKDNKVTVYDRWGGVVYSATGYNNESVAWKGLNANGGTAPTGTYFYTIAVRYRGNSLEKKGFIELIR